MGSYLSDIERADLESAIAYILQFGLDGRPLSKAMRCPAPALTAERIADQILRSNWDLRKRPPTRPHTAG